MMNPDIERKYLEELVKCGMEPKVIDFFAQTALINEVSISYFIHHAIVDLYAHYTQEPHYDIELEDEEEECMNNETRH